MEAADIDLLAYLHSKGLNPKAASQNEVHVACWYHGEDPGSRGRLYINVADDPQTKGLHVCFVCQTKGNLTTLLRHFGDELARDDDDDGVDRRIRQAILNKAAAFYHSSLEPDHLKWLREERGLTAESIKKHEIGYAGGGLYQHLVNEGFNLEEMKATGLIAVKSEGQLQGDDSFVLEKQGGTPYDWLKNAITIPYHVAGNCVQIRGRSLRDSGPKYLTPPRQKARLFNTDSLWGQDTCLAAEGEFDAILGEQLGVPSIGVPGAATWQENWDGYVDPMRRIYICFDNDSAGQLGAQALKERFGRKVRNVTLPDDDLPPGENDISRYFGKEGHTSEEFLDLLRKADKAGTLLITVDEAYEEWADMYGKQGIVYGFEELDQYMKVGHLPTKIVIVLSKTNSGKTLALQNIFQRLTMAPNQQDKKVLYVSMEQTRGDWFERARRIWNFWNLDCPAPDVNGETLNYWRDRISITDVNRMTGEDLVGAIDDFEDEWGQKPDLVAIDYLGYWARSFKGGNKYEQVSEAVATLKEIAKDKYIPILAPHQVSRSQEFGKELELDSGRDAGSVEEYADEVFVLWNPDTQMGTDISERKGNIKLKISKTRAGSKGRVVNMKFGYLSLAMAEIGEPDRVRMLNSEIEYENRADMVHLEPEIPTWEAAMFRHRTGIHTGDITPHLLKERGIEHA